MRMTGVNLTGRSAVPAASAVAGFAEDRLGVGRQAQRQREIDHNFESYIEWIEETMTTEKEPYIQLIAVITGAEG